MAQPAKPTARKTTPATGRPRGRPPGSKTKKPATAPVAPVKAPRTAAAKSVATQRKPLAAPAPATPKAGKEELRIQGLALQVGWYRFDNVLSQAWLFLEHGVPFI